MDITMICLECKNFFLKNGTADIHNGNYTISGGIITPLPASVIEGQYFRIVGSKMNDRVIKNTSDELETLSDETFSGAIWDMFVPAAFIALCDDISRWIEKNGTAESAALSPFTSESFGGYSYSKGSGGTSTGGSAIVWQDVFRPRLNAFRRISVL